MLVCLYARFSGGDRSSEQANKTFIPWPSNSSCGTTKAPLAQLALPSKTWSMIKELISDPFLSPSSRANWDGPGTTRNDICWLNSVPTIWQMTSFLLREERGSLELWSWNFITLWRSSPKTRSEVVNRERLCGTNALCFGCFRKVFFRHGGPLGSTDAIYLWSMLVCLYKKVKILQVRGRFWCVLNLNFETLRWGMHTRVTQL